MATGEPTHRTIEDLIEAGTAIAGGVVGATLGVLEGGPIGGAVGAVAGTAFASVFKAVAYDIKERFLGPREVMRIGAAMTFAVKHFERELKAGRKPRNDGFFGSKGKPKTGRSAAEEIIEAVLLASQREHQEKKIDFYGALLSSIAFDDSVDAEQANLLIRLGESLSYRQLCLLTLFGSSIRTSLRDTDYAKEEDLDTNRTALLVEIYELYVKGLVNSSGTAPLSIADVVPRKMRTQGTGSMLHNLTGLSRGRIFENDIRELADKLA